MNPYLQALLTAVISTGSTYATLVLTGYVTKKAQNRADIEDTAKITELQESVKHQFETLNAKVDLVNRNKFSLSDEIRKTIYDLNKYVVEILVFYHINSNPDFPFPENEDEFWNELKSKLYGMSVSWEKLKMLHSPFLQHTTLQHQFAARFNAITDAQNNTPDGEDSYPYVKVELDKLEMVEIAALRTILNGYLMKISE